MTSNNSNYNVDINALLKEVEHNEEDVERSDKNKKEMDMKGVSNDHHRRAAKQEMSFFNGLRSVGKWIRVTLFLLN